jgi:hypothetical protein
MKKKHLLKRKSWRIVMMIIFAALVIGFVFRGGIRDFVSNVFKPAIPAAKSIQDFTSQAGVHQNSRQQATEKVSTANPTKNSVVLSGTESANVIEKTPNISLPASANLNIPFQPQAPFGDWGLPYQEACEEASAIMVNAFFNNSPLTAKTMDSEILKLVDWEKKVLGHYEDTNAAEIVRILKEYFGRKDVEVLYEYTLDDIKKAISNGYPVIMTLAGRELNNPYFTPPGPIYHALVVKGYIKNWFITNDPGTKRGHDYLYDPQVLIKANHEWNAPDIDQGRHAIIIIKS